MTESGHGNEWSKSGSFESTSIGVNYWASHAGVFMWEDWQPDVVDADLAHLAEQGMEVARVFPLWRDFQPLSNLRKWHTVSVEYRNGEKPLARPDGISPPMLDRFAYLVACAEKYGLKLVVGLVTGWMSGRLFVPPALEGLNPITDTEALEWQVRFVQGIVETFRHAKPIVAWDLGNECNCMGKVTTASESWMWTSSIANAIRTSDPERPVISGMHSLKVDPTLPWSIRSQGELTDILTVHPYPLFTPYCLQEPLNTMRPLLHAAAESCLYADLSGRPVIVEEFGTLGPLVCDSQVAAQLARVSVYDCWAHGMGAALWWCAYDQNELEEAPYDWLPIERELGLYKSDRQRKPEALALVTARQDLCAYHEQFGVLPERRVEAVCLLTKGQDQWAAAFTAFVLAKQAGFDVRFHYCDQPIPDAELYLMPSVQNKAPLWRERERELWAKVEAGATLYHSMSVMGLAESRQYAGFDLVRHSNRSDACQFSYAGATFVADAPMRYELNVQAETDVLAQEDEGAPVYLRSQCGNGQVFSLLFPLETMLSKRAEVFLPQCNVPYWKLYEAFAAPFVGRRAIRKDSPWVGLTEHTLASGDVVVVATNYSSESVAMTIEINDDFMGVDVTPGQVGFPACSSQVWRLSRVQASQPHVQAGTRRG